MKKNAQFWLRIVIAAFVIWIVLSVHEVYWPVVVSLILTFVLMPVCRFFETGLNHFAKRKIPVDISIFLSFLLLIVVVFIITNSILKPLIMQVNLLAANFQDLVERTAKLIGELENNQTQVYIPDQVKALIDDALVRLGNYGVDGIKNVVSTAVVVAGTVIEFFIVPIITFYFMKDGKYMVHTFIDLFPEEYRPHMTITAREMGDVVSKYIRGMLIMSLIIAVVTFIGMWLMKVPYPMVIALLAGITEWIPIIGPIIGGAPAVLLAALVSPSLAVEVFIFYLVIQQIDSAVIRPLVMGAVIRIHPVAIVLAVLIGGALFGIAGMILMVPIIAVLQVVCRHLWFYDTYKAKAMNTYGKE